MLLRYPGGKGKAAKVITNRLVNFFVAHPHYSYREPFFGAGAIGFELLKDEDLKTIWFNDRDPAITAVWNSVAYHQDDLKKRLEAFKPSVDAFFEFKEFLLGISEPESLNMQPLPEVAFKKIACHQMSYSGLGTKAGGPIGGVKQGSKYSVDCRYSIKTLFKNIDKVWQLIRHRNPERHRFCTCLDFEEVIDAGSSQGTCLYLDPPYYAKGPDLYQFSFTTEDHRRLAAALKRTSHPWLLSYDDHPEVVELYQGWTKIEYIALKYTICAHDGAQTKRELLISSQNFNIA
jgi:DNA adenine methylase